QTLYTIDLLTNITEEARGKRPLIIAGDFNAWSTEWGCRATRQRATTLLDALAPLEAVLLNTGDTPTFTGALGYSVIDRSWRRPGERGLDRSTYITNKHDTRR
ncbi:endonuclease/exonuclease/phosphatase family protein, partial [Staphylococcus aureus]